MAKFKITADNPDYRVQVLHKIFVEEQNLNYAILAGFLSALAGMFIWSFILNYLIFPLHLITLGIGFGIASVMRIFGRCYELYYGVLSALFTLGCLLSADGMTMVSGLAIAQHKDFLSALAGCNFSLLTWGVISTVPFFNWPFYFASAGLAYWATFRRVSSADLLRVGITEEV